MSGALSGLTVLDLTHVLAGPFCTYQFALLGADVIKVEPPGAPDCARGRGPDERLNLAGLGLTYQVQAANKRAIAIDLKTEAGRALLLRLVAATDILVENYSTGTMVGLGLSYDDLCAVNPRLIYCSITGYGDTGPQATTGAYDNVIQAASGIVAQSGGTKPGLSFLDYATGYAAAFAALAAVHQRVRTGRGAKVSASMLEVAMSMMAPEVAALQRAPEIRREAEAGLAAYDTASGRLMLGAFLPGQYRALGQVLTSCGHRVEALDGIADWADVWRFSKTLRALLVPIFLTRTAENWAALLRVADVPAEPVRTLAEAARHPQLAARGYHRPSPADPDLMLPVAPYTMTEGGPGIVSAPAPTGLHTDEVLSGLGLEAAEIGALRDAGVIA